MPFLENRLLIQYISPPNNYIGSTLFLSYIVVALYLTSTIGYSLYTQYTSAFHSHAASTPSKFKQNGAGQVETRNARARHIKIYLSLAFLSFASISWHMLGFLITSILNWNNTSSRNVFVVLGDNGLLKLKSWMLETGLFNDFASQLVGDRESAIWAQLAILATWGWNLWMALKGRQYNFTTRHLLPFIVLGQNLPISFSAALFIIQLHLSSPDVNTSKKSYQPTSHPNPIASPLLPTIILNAILLAQPSLRTHPHFSTLVLAERLLLFLPHTGMLKLSDAEIKRCAAVSGGFVVANWAMLRKGSAVEDVLRVLLGGRGEAVGTLAWDVIGSAVVWVVLSWGGGV